MRIDGKCSLRYRPIFRGSFRYEERKWQVSAYRQNVSTLLKNSDPFLGYRISLYEASKSRNSQNWKLATTVLARAARKRGSASSRGEAREKVDRASYTSVSFFALEECEIAGGIAFLVKAKISYSHEM